MVRSEEWSRGPPPGPRASVEVGPRLAQHGVMNTHAAGNSRPHSPAWIAQVWIAFGLALFATGLGVIYLPVDVWMKGFLAMGLVFTVGSTLNVAKTMRDMHEAEKLTYRVEEARVERLLVEHDALK